MKLRLPSFLLLSFSLFTFSCGDQESTGDIVIDSFPEVQSVTSTPIEKIEMFTKGNVNLVVIDTFLVIQKREEPMVQIYSTNTHELLTSFGTKGKGPNQFERPDLIKQTLRDPANGAPIIQVFDYARRRISKINILDAIEKKDGFINQRRISEINSYLLRYYHEDDEMIIAKSEGFSWFIKYNAQDSSIKYVPFPEEFDYLKQSEDAHRVVFRSAITVNKEKKLIAVAPIMLGEVDFFDLEGNYLRSTIFSPRSELKSKFNDDKLLEMTMQIVDIQSTGDKMYALNHNNQSSTLRNERRRQDAKIQVFDWEGNPLKEYLLADNHFVRYFAYDERNNRIYAFAPDKEEDNVIMYELDK